VISLSQQALWAFDGPRAIASTFVSTGKAGFETPVGLFAVNLKLDVESMGGFAKGKEFFNVPDVPYVMYFTEHDHALHGTYWHEKFGTPMSHGCVNLPIPVAEWLYGWAPMEMPVLVVA
jgi:lipoprotein-anchoring transpeptidase ErfK/SrfK